MGISRVHTVQEQLEIHNFGRETCESQGFDFINAESWDKWPDVSADFCFGNPRCTSFSSLSGGASAVARGAFAEPTQDIMDLVQYGLRMKYDIIAFESVQQAYTVGKALLNRLRDAYFCPAGYRICHVFVNTAAEGNAQKRRRYFFIAYKRGKNFNVYAPKLPDRCACVHDVIGDIELLHKTVRPARLYSVNHAEPNMYVQLTPAENAAVKYLKSGECLNQMAKRLGVDGMRAIHPELADTMLRTLSEIPFSLHCIRRLDFYGRCPTIAGTAARFIHPMHNRPLTVEELALLMGWPKGVTPIGKNPIGQIGKGVVPATAEWLGRQIQAYLDDEWGSEDFESSWDKQTQQWVGNDYSSCNCEPVEKVFNLTYYLPKE